jgi:hypothetical protein
MHGTAWSREIDIPFLRDLAVNVRLLIAVPILVLAESPIDRRWKTLVHEFIKSELVNGETLPFFEVVLQRTTRWRDKVLPEALLVAASILPSIFIPQKRMADDRRFQLA